MAQDSGVLVVDLDDGGPGAPTPFDAPRAAAPGPPRGGRRWPPAWPERTPGWVRGPLGAVAAAALAAALVGPLAAARTSALADEHDRTHAQVVVGGGAFVTARAPSSYDYNTRALLELQLVNTGGVPVTLLDVSLSGAAVHFDDDLEAGREVAPGESASVLLSGPVPCLEDERLEPGAPTAVVRTADGTEHELALPVPESLSWGGGLQRACALSDRT